MNIRNASLGWLRQHYPAEMTSTVRSSKYYPEHELWFLTLPSDYLSGSNAGNLIILLQERGDPKSFHFLRVPFSFLRNNKQNFDLRSGGDKFDLHISAKAPKWLVEIRGRGVDFNPFLVSRGP
jgi:hypothetical protein